MFQVVAGAREQTGFSIETDQQVIYCAAQWNGNRESLARALKSGIDISFKWHIEVARNRSYWINESVAAIEFSRHVHPDLLTRQLLLEDSASGISRRAQSLDEAIDFLTHVEHFPVLDKSLLAPDELYELAIVIEKQEGHMGQTWWARFWKQSAMHLQQEFSLP